MEIKHVGAEIAKLTFAGGLGFGLGCLAGKIVKGPVLMTGALYGVVSVAKYAMDLATKSLATKHKWNFSTFNFASSLTAAIASTALAVGILALGILSPAGAATLLGISLAFDAIPLAMGLYAKYNGKDMLYSDAKKNEGAFYRFAT